MTLYLKQRSIYDQFERLAVARQDVELLLVLQYKCKQELGVRALAFMLRMLWLSAWRLPPCGLFIGDEHHHDGSKEVDEHLRPAHGSKHPSTLHCSSQPEMGLCWIMAIACMLYHSFTFTQASYLRASALRRRPRPFCWLTCTSNATRCPSLPPF